MVAGTNGGSARAATAAALDRIAADHHPGIWITLVDPGDALAAADAVDARAAAGDHLPLRGLTVAVKDNVDVAGLPTTAACPSFARRPGRTATAVDRLQAAGAVVVGKTNLDQFATGLVGTRSPFGICPNAHDPALIAGGSSSGSAVAVARGLVDIGVATDTAGSGRVPAALNRVFGVKPTPGRIPTDGVVPACAGLDCVSAMARDLATAELAVAVMAGEGAATMAAVAAPGLRIGVPGPGPLDKVVDEQVTARFASATGLLGRTIEVDVTDVIAAGDLLYGGGFAAARYAAVGEFLAAGPPDADPTVAAVILGAAAITGADVWRDLARLDELRARIAPLWEHADVLALPTVPIVPTLDDVAADPFGINATLGATNNFCNLLGWCAVTVPAGITFFAPAGRDELAAAAARLLAEPPVNSPAVVAEVQGVFDRYEAALVANDLAVLDELFWADPHVQRVGIADRQSGWDEVRAFRHAQARQTPPRRLERLEITTIGTGGIGTTATVTTEFVPLDGSRRGRQSQTWVRFPEGWRVTAAHVSHATGDSKTSGSTATGQGADLIS